MSNPDLDPRTYYLKRLIETVTDADPGDRAAIQDGLIQHFVEAITADIRAQLEEAHAQEIANLRAQITAELTAKLQAICEAWCDTWSTEWLAGHRQEKP